MENKLFFSSEQIVPGRLKLKGKPRAAMFNLISEDWGGYVMPWVNEIAELFNCKFEKYPR
jgi:hypothetical protein